MTGGIVRSAAVAAVTVASIVGLAVAPGLASAPVAAATTIPTYQWPEAHGNPQLTGVSGDTSINSTNAGLLGVRWMVNLAAQSLTSPVVGYNQTLGQTVVYAGSEGGWFSAYSEATGKTLWSVSLGSAIRSTPTLDGNYIWVAATYAPRLFKLDASTGAVLCSSSIYAVAEASPVVATPPGGIPTVYMGSNDQAQNGPVYAFNEADCSVEWQKVPYPGGGGLWDMMSYAVDAPTSAHPSGEPLVLFGTADPDGSIYALDAVTGVKVWRYQTYVANADSDVGSGITISSPGVNGFADGVVYTTGKDGVADAVDLTTGTKIWTYTFENPPQSNASRSTPALVGNQLVFGTSEGTFDLNATTGTLNWHYVLPVGDENLGAVAVEGPPGEQVVLTTNLDGQFQVLSLATGAVLYSYQTHNYVASSPAVVDRNVLFTSADGFLYDFALGGGNSSNPSTTITSPTSGSTIPYTSQVMVTGTASDPAGVNQVQVTVQEDGQEGQWWSVANNSWEPGPFTNQATLAAKGATSTTWSLRVPIPPRGTSIEVRSAAMNANHIDDTSSDDVQATSSKISFTVSPGPSSPTLQASAPRVPPGGTVTVTGGGYQPGEQVAINLATSPVQPLATATATSTGAIPPTSVTIPATTDFGPMALSALGLTSGSVGSTPEIISNDWDQFSDTAQRTGTEQNDNEIVTNVAPDGRFYFDQVYNVPASAPIHSSPVVNNGMAFFGDDAGSFFGVDVHTGSPRWQNSYSAGIDSTAAVDSNRVFFGTEGNSVVALDEQTGSQLWSVTTSSPVESSPAVYGGSVYVGSDDGTFYALDEQTGAVLWTKTLSAPIHSSPAVDPVNGNVVVGDDSGRVTAMSVSGGATAWTATTNAAVTATPLAYSGRIYVGSTDHFEYAWDAATGSSVWKHGTQGPIVSNTIGLDSRIAVGSEDGTLYYFKALTGVSTSQYLAGSPIMGIAGSQRIVVATLQSGVAVGNRIGGGETTWKYFGNGHGIASSPIVNNGIVYITGLDSNLRVFDAPGRPVY